MSRSAFVLALLCSIWSALPVRADEAAPSGQRIVRGRLLLVPASAGKKPSAGPDGEREDGYHVELRTTRCDGEICVNVYMHPPWPRRRAGRTVLTPEGGAECTLGNVTAAFFTITCRHVPPGGARVAFVAVGPAS
jgi:hypothetical protein